MLPDVTVTGNGHLDGCPGSNAILNVDRTGDPQTSWTGAFHSSNRTGYQDLVQLTITFPYPVRFDHVAFNTGSASGAYWSDETYGQWWNVTVDDVNIASKGMDQWPISGGYHFHDPCGPTPYGDYLQHEMMLLTPVIGTTLKLSFTPISRAGGYYWSVRDINVWITPDPKSDTLSAVDALGRYLPDYTDCGAPKSGKITAQQRYANSRRSASARILPVPPSRSNDPNG